MFSSIRILIIPLLSKGYRDAQITTRKGDDLKHSYSLSFLVVACKTSDFKHAV